MLYPDFQELLRIGTRRPPLGILSNRHTLTSASGNFASPFRGQGLTFHEVREYRPGDDIRNIDWRVTARTNKPHMKVFTEDRERMVILCVDANASMRFGTRGTFKSIQAARAAALLGWMANGSHDRVGCLLFGDLPEGLQIFKPVRSRQALWQALKLLSRHTTDEHPSMVPTEVALRHLEPFAPTGTLIFVISDFQSVTDALEKRLRSLRRRCDVVAIRIDDPADSSIPSIGSVAFSDALGDIVAVDTDNRAGCDTYARQWRANRVRLDDICARSGVGIVGLHTDGDVYGDLVPGLRRIAQGRRK